MRIVLAIALVLLPAACGGSGGAPRDATIAVTLPKATTSSKPALVAVPLYPNSSSPKVVVQPTYQSTDWTLPAGTQPTAVYDWYTSHLTARGWKVTQRNETGLHAVLGRHTLDVGVRGRTLEINQG